jgi:hypothetical protein
MPAGASAGTIALTIDYPNLMSMATAQEKLENDAEWQKYVEKLGDAGITVESNAIWLDITP